MIFFHAQINACICRRINDENIGYYKVVPLSSVLSPLLVFAMSVPSIRSGGTYIGFNFAEL